MTPATTRRIRLRNGDSLAVDVAPPRPGQPWVIFSHGLGSDRFGIKCTALAQELQHRGIGFVRFDYRGHGQSDGEAHDLSLERMLQDLDAVLDSILEIDAEARLILVGSSLGGLASAWCSTRRPGQIESQVLIAPAFRAVERLHDSLPKEEQRRWQREGLYTFERGPLLFRLNWDIVEETQSYSFEELIRRSHTPTRILHGTLDESVPVGMSQEFARATDCSQLDLVIDGDHGLNGHLDRVLALVLAAVKQH